MSGHWAGEYIGTPWVAGESDCWSFARRVWRERFGFNVPPLGLDPADPRAVRRALAGEHAGWVEVEHPREGDAVLMGQGRRACHVGVWIDDGIGGVLHSVEGAGVVFTGRASLPGMGYRIVGFYRRAAP